MKRKLEELTIAQFVDLACGDTSVLTGGKGSVPGHEAQSIAASIIFEYREIADPAGTNGYLRNLEELMQAKVDLLVYGICKDMLKFGELDSIRKVMNMYGINIESMNRQRVAAEIKSRFERARQAVARIEKDSQPDNGEEMDIRRSFDEQTASMIAYFKFQIDMATMKATIYAHLAARFERDIKARLAAIKK